MKCKYCDGEIERTFHQSHNKKYCSPKCRSKAGYYKRRDEHLERIKQDRKDNPEKRKAYRDKNREKINASARKWFGKNYESKLKPARKKRQASLPRKEKERQAEVRRKHKAEWWEKNKPRLTEERKLWMEKNPDYYHTPEYKERCAEHHARKKESDVHYVIRQRLGGRLRGAFKRTVGGVRANKRNKTYELLGCTGEEFRDYFKAKFTRGMSWKKFLAGEIHIDHIKPCVLFDLTKKSEQLKCFHHTNLQPLWARDNLSKGAKYNQ